MGETRELTFNKRNSLLNLLKGCGCIGVIFIHVKLPGMFGNLVQALAQFAVPVFYLISGYYSYSENTDINEKIKKRIKRLLIITACSLVFYFFYSLGINVFQGSAAEWLRSFLNIKRIIVMIVLNDLDLLYCGHLWFLPSQIIAYLILLFFYRTKTFNIAYKLLPLLFIIKLIVCIYIESKGYSFHFKTNFLIGALPWMLLGHYIAYNEKFRKALSNKCLTAVAVCSGFIVALLIFAFVKRIFAFDAIESGIIPFSTALFLLAVNNPEVSLSRPVQTLGDKYSLYVYICHIAVSGVLTLLLEFVGLHKNTAVLWLKPIVVALISVIISIVLYHIINNLKKRVADK